MADSLDRLLSQLNISGVQQSNNPLYQVIVELIRQIRLLKSQIDGTNTTNNTIINQEIIQQIIQGDGGDGDSLIIPGTKGDTGAAGATGATGPPFPAFIVLDPEQGEDLLPIPGNVGPTGATGATGVAGPVTLGPMGLDGDQGEDGFFVLPEKGLSWELIATQTVAGAANYDFTGLGSYAVIIVICVAITKGASQTLELRVSTDNGSTFLSTSGDYLIISTAGSPTNATQMNIHATASAAARYGQNIIYGFNKSTAKSATTFATNGQYIIPTTTPLNAVRVLSSGGTTLDAGTILVFGSR